MGFSIHYRSTESMHPAQAFEIKQHAARLASGYTWFSCEPVVLEQTSDGRMFGRSEPTFYPVETEADAIHTNGVPDGTVLVLAEILCELSRQHGIDWDIGHSYEPVPFGKIRDGSPDGDLLEQLETLGSIGNLLDDDGDDSVVWDSPTRGIVSDDRDDVHEDLDVVPVEEDADNSGPRLLKFPNRDP